MFCDKFLRENLHRSSRTFSDAALKQRKFFRSCSFSEYSLAKHILMTYKSLRIFSFFVSVAVKQFTRSGGINLSCSSKCEILLVCVCILGLVILHVNRFFPPLIVLSSVECLILPSFPTFLIKAFWKTFIEHKMWGLISSKIYFWNSS